MNDFNNNIIIKNVNFFDSRALTKCFKNMSLTKIKLNENNS